jgi:hypothetical protein
MMPLAFAAEFCLLNVVVYMWDNCFLFII